MNKNSSTLVKVLVATLFASVTLLTAKPARVYVEFEPSTQTAVKAAVHAVGGQVHHEFEELGALAVSVP
jgi:hypothetical protein